MNELTLKAYVEQKLTGYRREAETVRGVGRRSLRSQVAQALRGLAERLEPSPALAAPCP